MKLNKLGLLFAIGMLLIIGIAMPASATDEQTHTHITLSDISEHFKNRIADWWEGWTVLRSEYREYTAEWISDTKQHIREIVTDRSKSFEDRAKAQAYALGWDDRFDYVEKYGTVDYETGTITYDVGFWDGLFGGLKSRDKWFTTVEEYDAAMSVYMENYNTVAQAVPREV